MVRLGPSPSSACLGHCRAVGDGQTATSTLSRVPQQVPSTYFVVADTPVQFLQGWWKLSAFIAAASCAFAVVVATSTSGDLRPVLVVLAAALFPVEGLLHEAAHAAGARRLGMRVDGIVIDNTAGIALAYEGSLQARLVVALLGPAASLCVLGVTAAVGFGTQPVLDLAPLLVPAVAVAVGIVNSFFAPWGDLDMALHS